MDNIHSTRLQQHNYLLRFAQTKQITPTIVRGGGKKKAKKPAKQAAKRTLQSSFILPYSYKTRGHYPDPIPSWNTLSVWTLQIYFEIFDGSGNWE